MPSRCDKDLLREKMIVRAIWIRRDRKHLVGISFLQNLPSFFVKRMALRPAKHGNIIPVQHNELPRLARIEAIITNSIFRIDAKSLIQDLHMQDGVSYVISKAGVHCFDFAYGHLHPSGLLEHEPPNTQILHTFGRQRLWCIRCLKPNLKHSQHLIFHGE